MPAGIGDGHPEATMKSKDRMATALQRKQAMRDQVRVAYGEVPVVLEVFPVGDPVRLKIRDRARATLVDRGYLTAAEVDTLPLKDAIAAVLTRLRGEAFPADRGRASASPSERRSAPSKVS
jgi:hypothetical protein